HDTPDTPTTPTPPTCGTPPTPHTPNATRTKNASEKWKAGSLGVIINQYKRAVTIGARKMQPGFTWQPRYHDRIIRNDYAYQCIPTYIIENPEKWKEDTFYPDGRLI